MRKFYAFTILLNLALLSCNTNSEVPANYIKINRFKDALSEVNIAKVKQGLFNLEVISNGKAYAVRTAEIKFPVNEQIKEIFVKNGVSVTGGQMLALLNSAEYKKNIDRSKENLEKTMVDLDDRLIDYGYRLKDSLKVPTDIMRMARIKSGYNKAKYEYSDAKMLLKKTQIIAPFSGKIANLEAKEYNNSDVFKKLCTIIDDSSMLIEFNILETEYYLLNKGSMVEVHPYGSEQSLNGRVVQINPSIDYNGMIRVTALVANSGGYLLDGMSVKIIVKKEVANKLYIPKEALLQRQDREVVFTYEDGRAKWNYVQTGLQNTKYITINSGLQRDQYVITSNNFNLAHDQKVKLKRSSLGSE